MSITYEPRPGTVAFRALAHLGTLPPGTEMMTSALAEAIGLAANHLSPNLEPALSAGRVFRRQRDNHVRSPFFWSLTDNRRPPLDLRKPLLNGEAYDAGEAPAQAPNPEGAAAAASIPPELGSQHVVKATAARPDATARETQANASPVGGPMGVVQPSAAGHVGDDQRRGPAAVGAQVDGCRAPECHAGVCSGHPQRDQLSPPASPMRIALWSDGTLQVQRDGAELALLSAEEVEQLLGYIHQLRVTLA